MKGKIIITTQPADQASEMLRLIDEKGAIGFNLPMIETQTITLSDNMINQLTLPGSYDLLVFTSKKGVKGFFENVIRVQENYALPTGLKIAAIGNSTATELLNYNHSADFINPGNDASDFAEYLLENIIQPNFKILLALGNKAPDFLMEYLSIKALVKRIDVYVTRHLKPTNHEIADLISNKAADMCIFTSPSGFFAFYDAFNDIKGLNLATIGNTTATAIINAGYQVSVIAPTPSPQALINAIEMFFKEIK
jgi:uroporphyrinogen-III synthase